MYGNMDFIQVLDRGREGGYCHGLVPSRSITVFFQLLGREVTRDFDGNFRSFSSHFVYLVNNNSFS